MVAGETLSDCALLRYSRHLLLTEFPPEAQERLAASRVLVVGLGGLGSPAALYLASAGVGHLVLADGDTVDLTNLQRQIAHSEARIGINKAESAKTAAGQRNSDIEIIALPERLSAERLSEEVGLADLVLDCSDNFPTRHAVNRACVAQKTPLVFGAAIRFSGQVGVYDPQVADSPCYACLFPEDATDDPDDRCATTGVFSPLVGLVGTLQAGQAIKQLTGIGPTLTGQLLLIDALTDRFRTIRVKQDAACAVCGPGRTKK
ncbi:MAG: HesA/MoeB/ThiF family protein [Zoogloeaceae bacterium]|jgi:adenylyltransferase/sulfurtransferase|nr:HesA/MoeB/ThiF family protein [Zoogloeaceae bacterium]